MSYGFSMPMNYGTETQQNQKPMYDTYGTPYPDVAVNQNQTPIPVNNNIAYSNYGYKKPSSVPAALGGFVVGGGTAGILKAIKNPNISKKGEFSDTFVKNTYEAIMNSEDDGNKIIYQQRRNILDKIDKVSNKDELKTLINDNSAAVEPLINTRKMPAGFANNIDDRNFKSSKKALKNAISESENLSKEDVKNTILRCWDSATKKFVKPDNVEEKEFDIIKKMSKKGMGKGALKAILIWGAITGAVAGIVHKIFTTPRQQ